MFIPPMRKHRLPRGTRSVRTQGVKWLQGNLLSEVKQELPDWILKSLLKRFYKYGSHGVQERVGKQAELGPGIQLSCSLHEALDLIHGTTTERGEGKGEGERGRWFLSFLFLLFLLRRNKERIKRGRKKEVRLSNR